MQDVHLGLLVALLPALAGRKNVAPAKAISGGHDSANDSGTKYLTCGLLQAQLQKSYSATLEPGYFMEKS